MRRFSVLAMVLAVLFYVAWPAWSAFQLKNALDRGDVPGVERGIDFPAVRQSLRPIVTQGIEENLKDVTKGAAGSDVLIDAFGKETLPKIVEASLDALLTPEAIIRLYADGKTLREFIWLRSRTFRQGCRSQNAGRGCRAGCGPIRFADRAREPAFGARQYQIGRPRRTVGDQAWPCPGSQGHGSGPDGHDGLYRHRLACDPPHPGEMNSERHPRSP